MTQHFHQAPFAVRYTQMGDVAEGVFEKVFPAHHRLGLNRPNLRVMSLPYITRFLPDFLVADGMVEVMGIGRDKTLKFKIEKMHNLLRWGMVCPVHLFVYDSSRKKWYYAPIEQWFQAATAHGTLDHFEDNNSPYLRLLSDNFPCEGVKYDGEA